MNKLKLGKKKILGFVTAGAIVVTMAGSYAAWDTLSETGVQDLTFATPVTTSVKMDTAFTETRELDDAPVYEAPVTFAVSDLPTDIKDMEASFTTQVIEAESKAVVDTADYSITILKSGEALENNVDSAIVTDGTANNYTVKVVPADTENAKKLAGKKLTVSVTGTLQKTATTPSTP